MIADQKVMTFVALFYPTASATAYGQRPKFVRAEHSATATCIFNDVKATKSTRLIKRMKKDEFLLFSPVF